MSFITKSQLKQIIKEELTSFLLKENRPSGVDPQEWEDRVKRTRIHQRDAARKAAEAREKTRAREAATEEEAEEREAKWKKARAAADMKARGHVVTTAHGEPLSVPEDPRYTGTAAQRAAAWRRHYAKDKQTDIMPDEPRGSLDPATMEREDQWGSREGIPLTDLGPEMKDHVAALRKREIGRGGPGHLLSTDELSDAQFAGEMAAIPAEFLKGVAGMTPASAALATTEAAALAADSPYALRPGRSEFYRSFSEAPDLQLLRSARIARKKEELGKGVNSEEELEKAYLQLRPYIEKDRKGNIHIRAAGDKMGAAYDTAPWSADLGREIKDSFFDVRKRLIAVRKKFPTKRGESREEKLLIQQAKKLGIDPKKYMTRYYRDKRKKTKKRQRVAKRAKR